MSNVVNTDPRTEEEILAGVVPGHPVIVLGGVSYPMVEPTNERSRRIRRILTEYRDEAVKPHTESEQLELVEVMIDNTLKACSETIEGDWERIARTATDRERLTAIAAIRDGVMVPFQQVVAVATPKPNRKARREQKAGGLATTS